MIQKRVSPLYVARPVKNGRAILDWARSQGLEPNVDDLHVTILYSRATVDWFKMGDSYAEELTIPRGGARSVERFGDAIVVRFGAGELGWRHQQMIEAGASSDFEDYKPHVTVVYDAPRDLDLSGIEPYTGEIVLGPEEFKELDLDRSGTMKNMNDGVSLQGKITKVDADERIAYGWFSVIEKDGKAVVDSQGDVIAEKTLTKAVHEFLVDSRAGKVMHGGRRVADVVESMVFSKDVQKALGIDLGLVGWFGAMKFRDDAVWERVKSGELKAFSIGGTAKMKEIA